MLLQLMKSLYLLRVQFSAVVFLLLTRQVCNVVSNHQLSVPLCHRFGCLCCIATLIAMRWYAESPLRDLLNDTRGLAAVSCPLRRVALDFRVNRWRKATHKMFNLCDFITCVEVCHSLGTTTVCGNTSREYALLTNQLKTYIWQHLWQGLFLNVIPIGKLKTVSLSDLTKWQFCWLMGGYVAYQRYIIFSRNRDNLFTLSGSPLTSTACVSLWGLIIWPRAA